MSLMVSISGVRGIVGTSLTPDVVMRYVSAFGQYCKAQQPEKTAIVLGRDGRVTGKLFGNIISSTLLSMGIDVRAIGVCPTPTVALAVERSDAAGGISITASHNPMEWNGMKFIGGNGMFLDADENRKLSTMAEKANFRYSAWNALGHHSVADVWIRKHIEAVIALPYTDKSLLQKRHFKVVVDCANSAGGAIMPALLKELGCTVIEMNCDMSGVFSHTPEPLFENLGDLASRVVSEKADLGVAVDPDVDRLVLITERGEPFGEENTIAAAVKFVLGKKRKREIRVRPADFGGQAGERRMEKVVVNLSTTRAVDDIAAEYGAQVLRTPVGEINVAKRMKEVGAIIGGEGSGGVILPELHLGRDAIVGTGLLLQMLAESGGSLSAVKEGLPHYSIVKEKIELGNSSPDAALEKMRAAHNGRGSVNTDDGLKIDYPDYWVHLRKSNTEPIIRVIAEARTLTQAQTAMQKTMKDITTA